MNVKLVNAVIEKGPKDRTLAFVLLAIAWHADSTGICWPGEDRISRMARVDERTVIRALKKLEGEGWVRIERRCLPNIRNGRKLQGQRNCYLVNLKKLFSKLSDTVSSDAVSPKKEVNKADYSPTKGLCESYGNPVEKLRMDCVKPGFR